MKAIYIFGIVLVAVILFFAFGGNEQELEDSERAAIKRQVPITLTKAELTDFGLGYRKWTIRAETAAIYQKEELTLVSKLTVEIPSRSKNGLITLIKSDEGRIEGKSGIIKIRQNVYVRFEDGRQLYTEEMTIDETNETPFTDSEVKLVSESDTIIGTSMRYNLKTGIMNLAQPKGNLNIGI